MTSSTCPAWGLLQGNPIRVTVHKSGTLLPYTIPEGCCAVNCSHHDERGFSSVGFDEARRKQLA